MRFRTNDQDLLLTVLPLFLSSSLLWLFFGSLTGLQERLTLQAFLPSQSLPAIAPFLPLGWYPR
jgi:hypothetical protein